MLVVISLLVGMNAVIHFGPGPTEYQIAASIRRWSDKPGENQFVAELERELLRERNTRRADALPWLVLFGLLVFLAVAAARRALRAESLHLEFEPRTFQPFQRSWLGAVRHFSSAVLSRGARVANARSNLRPTLERLFGSKDG